MTKDTSPQPAPCLKEIIKTFPEFDFTILAKVYEHYVDFAVYQIDFWAQSDPLNAQSAYDKPLWHKKDASTRPDGVETLEEAVVYLSGSVKWDGCSNWHFDEQDRCMLHGCSRDDLLNLGEIMAACWDITEEHCPGWM